MAEKQVLDSWKEIADYLKRSVNTCQRLEHELGLPIHRLEDSPKARVFAYKEEIDLWIEKTQHSKKKILFGGLRLQKLIIPAFVVIVIVIVAVVIWQLLPQKTEISPLPPKLSVAVISFENQTLDNSYDYLRKVIPNLLITSLEQSGYFYVTSWERLHDLLKQIGKEDVGVIDKDLGFELCQMDDVDAIVIGSFAKAGDMFVTDVKVLDVETKRILKSANSRGKGEESILQSQIDELSREISHGIGLSEGKTEGTPLHIADVTTDSLDAYHYFLRGKEYYYKYRYDLSRKLLKKAVEFDPNFAMAYLYLGSSLRMLRESEAATEAYKKAKLYSARATEKERLQIESTYVSKVEKNLKKNLSLCKKLVRLYPKEKIFHVMLAMTYYSKELFNQAIEEYNKALELDPYDHDTLNGIAIAYCRLKNYEKAIEHLKKATSILPENALAFFFLGDVYFEMGKLDEAITKYKEALEVEPAQGLEHVISYFYALKEDYPEALRWIDQYTKVVTPEHKGWSYFVKSFYQYWLGSLDESMSNLLSQIDLADTTGITRWKANAYWMMGWIGYERGDYEACRKHFKSWFNIYMQDVLPKQDGWPGIPILTGRKKHWTAWYYLHLGLADVKQGEIKSAKSRLDKMNSLLPDVLPRFKDWIKFFYNYLQAEILLAEGEVDKAIIRCETSSPSQLVFSLSWGPYDGNVLFLNVPFLKDVLARAYQQNGEIDKAIAEYERLTVFDPQREMRHLIHPKYYYRLAELYEQQGDEAKAIEHYEKFLDLWKDADPGIAEVDDAKKRLAGLKEQ